MKVIENKKNVRDKIYHALELITEPVVGTLSPMGLNVIFEDAHGNISQTNDGVTIAKQVASDDPIEQAVIEVVRHSALKTNSVAGDGTTTTVLLTNVLIRDCLRLIDDGKNPMELSKDLVTMGEKLIKQLKPIEIKNNKELRNIAKISSNNDDDIAGHVLDVVTTAGEDGMVFIEAHNKPDTIVEKDVGFIIDGGLFSPEYAQNQGFVASFEDCSVLICDKRLYYEEEAETILRTALENGISKLVIVARDFIGKAVNVFSAVHQKNPSIDLILVKDGNENSLSDLAIYLDGTLLTEKTGKLVDKLKPSDFSQAKKVYSNPHRTVISPMSEKTKKLDNLISSLKEEKEKDEDDKEVQRRLAALTNGMVTVRVGGSTAIEVQERVYRFEDAINATRSAMKHGYLPGGGISLLSTFYTVDHPKEYHTMLRRYCEAPLRQIAKNCGKHEETILAGVAPMFNTGYNAKTDAFEDLIVAGVIDPFKVLEMSILNSISVANVILTTNWFIVNAPDKKEDND